MPIFDGNAVDLQDRDGTVGTTSGNVMVAAKSEDLSRSRSLRVNESGLVVDQRSTHELLETILGQILSIGENYE